MPLASSPCRASLKSVPAWPNSELEVPYGRLSNDLRAKLQHLSEANRALVREWLDIVANDSENLERTMRCMTDDCIWVMEPGGSEYRGSEQIREFVRIAMSGRTHDNGEHRLLITNWFADSENLCYEYTHGLIATGKFTAGIKGNRTQLIQAWDLRGYVSFSQKETT
jgi:uncharacterized protein YggL (DUF469 family)